MSLIRNEQVKLLAMALNTAATSCFTVGIATPVAGYLYNVNDLRYAISLGALVFGTACWLGVAIAFHLFAVLVLRKLQR